MKRGTVAVVTLAAAVAIFLLIPRKINLAPPPSLPPPVTEIPAPPPPIRENPVSHSPAIEIAASLNSPDQLPEDDISNLEMLLGIYRKDQQGGNPVGDNAEVTAALIGGNPKRICYLTGSAAIINDHGELIDRWGTPYNFHALSGTHMEIRSAGPDRVLWTGDDILSE